MNYSLEYVENWIEDTSVLKERQIFLSSNTDMEYDLILAISRVTASTIAESEYIKNPCMQKSRRNGIAKSDFECSFTFRKFILMFLF